MYGERLKSLREDNDYKQKEIADKIGIGLRTYQKYESEEIEPKVSVLSFLAQLYGCTIDYILGRTNHPREGISEFAINNKKVSIGYDKNIFPHGVDKKTLIELLQNEVEKNNNKAIENVIDKLTK